MDVPENEIRLISFRMEGSAKQAKTIRTLAINIAGLPLQVLALNS